MGTEVTQVLQGRFRTIDGPTLFLKIDTEGDKTRSEGIRFQIFTKRWAEENLRRVKVNFSFENFEGQDEVSSEASAF